MNRAGINDILHIRLNKEIVIYKDGMRDLQSDLGSIDLLPCPFGQISDREIIL